MLPLLNWIQTSGCQNWWYFPQNVRSKWNLRHFHQQNWLFFLLFFLKIKYSAASHTCELNTYEGFFQFVINLLLINVTCQRKRSPSIFTLTASAKEKKGGKNHLITKVSLQKLKRDVKRIFFLFLPLIFRSFLWSLCFPPSYSNDSWN